MKEEIVAIALKVLIEEIAKRVAKKAGRKDKKVKR